MDNRLKLLVCFLIFSSIGFNPLFSKEQSISTTVLVINSIKVFEKSQLGEDILVSFQQAASKLKMEADLNVEKFEREELQLTKKRDTLSKKEFNNLAEDFDVRVQNIRNLYDLKDRQLSAKMDVWKKKFIELSGRVIQPIMNNYGAFIVLDSTQIDLFFDNRIDITDKVIFDLNDLYKSNPKYLEFIVGE